MFIYYLLAGLPGNKYLMKPLISSANGLSIIQVVSLMLAIVGINYFYFTPWHVLLIFVGYFMMAVLGISITYHRYYSHRSFEFKYSWMKHLFTFFGILAGRGSPLGWSYVHRLHHRFVDSPKDPHYMGAHGWKVIIPSFMQYGARISKRYIKDLLTSYHIRINEYYSAIIILWAALLGMIDINLLYFFYIIPLVATFVSLNLFVLLTHTHGYRLHDTNDLSRNNWLVSVLLFGEGWHNRHHHDSSLSNLKVKWWELDICGNIIGMIKRD